MEQGVVFGRDMLGYDVRGGQMFINEEGAKTVRLIFHKFVTEGKGTHVIARELREAEVKSYTHKSQWSSTVIARIIRNEKYCGDLVQKKTFTPDYLTHEKKRNRGEEQFVVLKNHHQPIISREVFEHAAAILESRARSQEGKAKHSSRYAFSGKIKCADCGSTYVARYRSRADGSKYKAWRCFKAVRQGKPHLDKTGSLVGCKNQSIRNEDAAQIVGFVVQSLNFDKELVVHNLLAAIKGVLPADNTQIKTQHLKAKLADLEAQGPRLIEIYISGAITRDEFVAARSKLDAQLLQARGLIASTGSQGTPVQNRHTLISEIEVALRDILEGTCPDDTFYRGILSRMIVHGRGRVDVLLEFLQHSWSYAI